MSARELIPVTELCTHYKVEMSFFTRLDEFGLIEMRTVEHVKCIQLERIGDVERIIRLQQDLDVNLEGIDVVLNLLQRIDAMREQMTEMQNKLRAFEGDQ